jgi:hypothetical protein
MFRKKILILLPLILMASAGQSQIEVPQSVMQPTEVIQKAKRHSPLRSWLWNTDTTPEWDNSQKQWTFIIYKYKHINRGQCKYTNGCTIVKKLAVTIDDHNKKVVSKKISKTQYYNYE